MKKQDYINSINELESKKKQLSKEIDLLKSEFITKFSSFKIGDIVVITNQSGESRKAFISSVNLNGDFSFYYRYKKMKKDGKMSSHSDFAWFHDKVELSKE